MKWLLIFIAIAVAAAISPLLLAAGITLFVWHACRTAPTPTRRRR